MTWLWCLASFLIGYALGACLTFREAKHLRWKVVAAEDKAEVALVRLGEIARENERLKRGFRKVRGGTRDR